MLLSLQGEEGLYGLHGTFEIDTSRCCKLFTEGNCTEEEKLTTVSEYLLRYGFPVP